MKLVLLQTREGLEWSKVPSQWSWKIFWMLDGLFNWFPFKSPVIKFVTDIYGSSHFLKSGDWNRRILDKCRIFNPALVGEQLYELCLNLFSVLIRIKSTALINIYIYIYYTIHIDVGCNHYLDIFVIEFQWIFIIQTIVSYKN